MLAFGVQPEYSLAGWYTKLGQVIGSHIETKIARSAFFSKIRNSFFGGLLTFFLGLGGMSAACTEAEYISYVESCTGVVEGIEYQMERIVGSDLARVVAMSDTDIIVTEAACETLYEAVEAGTEMTCEEFAAVTADRAISRVAQVADMEEAFYDSLLPNTADRVLADFSLSEPIETLFNGLVKGEVPMEYASTYADMAVESVNVINNGGREFCYNNADDPDLYYSKTDPRYELRYLNEGFYSDFSSYSVVKDIYAKVKSGILGTAMNLHVGLPEEPGYWSASLWSSMLRDGGLDEFYGVFRGDGDYSVDVKGDSGDWLFFVTEKHYSCQGAALSFLPYHADGEPWRNEDGSLHYLHWPDGEAYPRCYYVQDSANGGATLDGVHVRVVDESSDNLRIVVDCDDGSNRLLFNGMTGSFHGHHLAGSSNPSSSDINAVVDYGFEVSDRSVSIHGLDPLASDALHSDYRLPEYHVYVNPAHLNLWSVEKHYSNGLVKKSVLSSVCDSITNMVDSVLNQGVSIVGNDAVADLASDSYPSRGTADFSNYVDNTVDDNLVFHADGNGNHPDTAEKSIEDGHDSSIDDYSDFTKVADVTPVKPSDPSDVAPRPSDDVFEPSRPKSDEVGSPDSVPKAYEETSKPTSLPRLRSALSTKLGDLGDSVSDKFPFSIPFNVNRAISSLVADPEAPSVTWVFALPAPIGRKELLVDLSPFSPVAVVLRVMMNVVLTFSVIGLLSKVAQVFGYVSKEGG